MQSSEAGHRHPKVREIALLVISIMLSVSGFMSVVQGYADWVKVLATMPEMYEQIKSTY